jgi:chaperonin GroES
VSLVHGEGNAQVFLPTKGNYLNGVLAKGVTLMKFRPLHDRVVVRRVEGEAKTAGGIIIPDTVKEKPQEGEVVAVGPGTHDEHGKLMSMNVKEGDRILFGKWSGTEVKISGEDLLIMKESDILGILECCGGKDHKCGCKK